MIWSYDKGMGQKNQAPESIFKYVNLTLVIRICCLLRRCIESPSNAHSYINAQGLYYWSCGTMHLILKGPIKMYNYTNKTYSFLKCAKYFLLYCKVVMVALWGGNTTVATAVVKKLKCCIIICFTWKSKSVLCRWKAEIGIYVLCKKRPLTTSAVVSVLI